MLKTSKILASSLKVELHCSSFYTTLANEVIIFQAESITVGFSNASLVFKASRL